jgi:ABC-type branched-subunit amino acid transport system permease subunit
MLARILACLHGCPIPLGATTAAVIALVIGVCLLRLAGAYVALSYLRHRYMIYTPIIQNQSATSRRRQWSYVLGWHEWVFSVSDFGFRQWLKGSWLLGNYFTVLWPLLFPWLVQSSLSMVGWGWRFER